MSISITGVLLAALFVIIIIIGFSIEGSNHRRLFLVGALTMWVFACIALAFAGLPALKTSTPAPTPSLSSLSYSLSDHADAQPLAGV